MKIAILGLSLGDLEAFLEKHKIPKFRAGQIMMWLHKFNTKSFKEMHNIGHDLQRFLEERFYIRNFENIKIFKSLDGTIKFLLNDSVETVFIPTTKRNTVCVSSQVGCSVGCKFCYTGYNGFKRNLTPSEIVEQLVIVEEYIGQESRLSNVVFMGMGEPLHNTENVLKAINTMINLRDFSRRKITLSTSGIVPELLRIAEFLECRLAISLHAPNDNIRNQIMPINSIYNISSIMQACHIYCRHHHSMKITFEYLMLNGINDSTNCAHALVNLLGHLNSKVNIIRFNPWSGCQFKPSSNATIQKFATILTNAGIDAPIRERRGLDIMAACGQLYSA
jgi:23S rRNA (adenine2503-C2)-methyltransferase